MDESDRSTIWRYDDGEPGEFYYARYAHPAGVAAERTLGGLEQGEALLYSSGMAASATVVVALAAPGATIAIAEGAYFGTSRLFEELARWGLRYVEYDQRGAPPKADIVWIEAPANPLLTMPDFGAATRSDALTVCDATVARLCTFVHWTWASTWSSTPPRSSSPDTTTRSSGRRSPGTRSSPRGFARCETTPARSRGRMPRWRSLRGLQRWTNG